MKLVGNYFFVLSLLHSDNHSSSSMDTATSFCNNVSSLAKHFLPHSFPAVFFHFLNMGITLSMARAINDFCSDICSVLVCFFCVKDDIKAG